MTYKENPPSTQPNYTQGSDPYDTEVSFVDILSVLIQKKALVLFTTSAFILLSIGYLLFRKYFTR